MFNFAICSQCILDFQGDVAMNSLLVPGQAYGAPILIGTALHMALMQSFKSSTFFNKIIFAVYL